MHGPIQSHKTEPLKKRYIQIYPSLSVLLTRMDRLFLTDRHVRHSYNYKVPTCSTSVNSLNGLIRPRFFCCAKESVPAAGSPWKMVFALCRERDGADHGGAGDPGLGQDLLFAQVRLNSWAQCCRSGMFIPDPVSWSFPSRIRQQKREGKKLLSYLFVAINLTKLKIILFMNSDQKIFEQLTKN